MAPALSTRCSRSMLPALLGAWEHPGQGTRRSFRGWRWGSLWPWRSSLFDRGYSEEGILGSEGEKRFDEAIVPMTLSDSLSRSGRGEYLSSSAEQEIRRELEDALRASRPLSRQRRRRRWWYATLVSVVVLSTVTVSLYDRPGGTAAAPLPAIRVSDSWNNETIRITSNEIQTEVDQTTVIVLNSTGEISLCKMQLTAYAGWDPCSSGCAGSGNVELLANISGAIVPPLAPTSVLMNATIYNRSGSMLMDPIYIAVFNPLNTQTPNFNATYNGSDPYALYGPGSTEDVAILHHDPATRSGTYYFRLTDIFYIFMNPIHAYLSTLDTFAFSAYLRGLGTNISCNETIYYYHIYA